MNKIKSMWFDGFRTLTYNCLYNFIIGNRGAGKSYWSKKWAIKDFLKNGKQFVYVRRYQTEFKKLPTFFADISQEFPDVEFEVKGKTFYINKKVAGYALTLSTSKIEKSNSYPNVNKIIFDEFIIDKGVYHYLQDEVNTFLDLYETVARARNDVIVFFISNAITMTNPYFLYFDLQLPYNKDIVRKGDLLLQMVADKDFIEMKKNTRFGKIIKGTDYAQYSIENKFLRDTDTFIKRKTEKSKYYFSIKYKGELYGLWIDYTEGKIFVSENVDPSCKLIYSITLTDHSPNTLLLNRLSKATLFKQFIDNYKLGNVYFENMKIKNIIYEVIKLCV